MKDLRILLDTMLVRANHIGFMENSHMTNEYKILEMKDDLEEMKEEFFALLEERLNG